MTRLLQAPTVEGVARRLDGPTPVLDAATRDLVARAEAEAYARGRVDGAREAGQASERAGRQAVQAMTSAVEDVRDALHEDGVARTEAAAALGRQLAEAILGHELVDGGPVLVDRVLAAAAALDHGPFAVHVAARDHALVAAHVHALPADTTVVVDDHLAPGEARIAGPWSGADLTLRSMLAVLTEQQP